MTLTFPFLSSIRLGLNTRPLAIHVAVGVTASPGLSVLGLVEPHGREVRERVQRALTRVGLDVSTVFVEVRIGDGGSDLHPPEPVDLAVALAVLVAAGRLPEACLDRRLALGALDPDSAVLPVRGVLTHLRCARERGLAQALVPIANQQEAGLDVMETYAFAFLRDAIEHLTGARRAERVRDTRRFFTPSGSM